MIKEAQSDSIPHADLYDLEPTPEPVSDDVKQDLMRSAKSFAQLSQNLEKDFYSYSEFYVLSVRWLNRWKVFVSYDEAVAGSKPTKLIGSGKLPTINEDIVDQKYIMDFIELESPWDHLNIALKPDLKQGQDYVLVHKAIWELFDDYKDKIEIRRHMEKTKDGRKVEVYFRRVNIIALFVQILRDIERDSVNKFTKYPVQLPQYRLLEPVLERYGNEIKKNINKSHYYRTINFTSDLPKLWSVQEGLGDRKLIERLYNGCKGNRTYEYKMGFPGTYLTVEDNSLQKLEISPDINIVMELRQNLMDWVFFSKNHRITGKCEHCNRVDKLICNCSCNFVAYCSQECRKADKVNHRYRCDRNAESSEDQKELVLTEASKRGRMGLRNLGNTCFMNSGIQCLTSVEQLTHYFLSKTYETQINMNNPLGTRGQLAKAYAKLIITMWYGTENSVAPTQLKRAIGNFQSMFSGYEQHDSGELISYLLDGLHEDHNRVKVKPFVENKDYDERPDEVVARESWENFLKRNDSIITDLMYGQFKSRLDCPKCMSHSITFDPFLMCPIPIPQDNRRNLVIRYLKDNVYNYVTTFWFEKDKGVKFQNALEHACRIFKIPADQRCIAYGSSTYNCTEIDPKTDANEVRKDYRIKNITIRNLEDQEDPENGVKILLKQTQNHSNYENFRKSLTNLRPYMFPANMKTTDFHKKVFKMFRKIIDEDVKDYEKDVLRVDPEKQPFRILIDSDARFDTCPFCLKKNCQNCPLPYDDNITLQDLTKKIRYFNGSLEIEVFWKKNGSTIEDEYNKDYRADAMSDAPSPNGKTSQNKLNIYDCLKYGQEPEILEEENAWYCPKCKDFVLAKKQLSIYKAPEILILNFKRFKGKGFRGILKTKLEAEVDFPIQGLDMTDYVANPELPNTFIKNGGQVNGVSQKPLLYDLFAISNHYGGLGGGHYTAYCKKGNTWNEYDDSSVSPISEDHLVGTQSYVLFYKRRRNTASAS